MSTRVAIVCLLVCALLCEAAARIQVSSSSDAHSLTACRLKCKNLKEWPCVGFRHLANGTCLLYKKAPCFNKDTTTEKPADISTCPGNVTDQCGCPDGFERCAGRCLLFLGEGRNYTQAEDRCADLGAIVVTPRSEEENQCAVAVAAPAAADGGVFPLLGYRGGRTNESFVGADGEGGITYSNWAAGQPGLTNDDNCVLFDPHTGKWGDVTCSTIRDVVCQLAGCNRPECSDE